MLKILSSGWMCNMQKPLGRCSAVHLFHDASNDPSRKSFFCNIRVSLLGKDVEAHASHMILHMLHQTTKPTSSLSRQMTLIHTCKKHSLGTIPTAIHIIFDVGQVIGTSRRFVMMHVLPPNKFVRLSMIVMLHVRSQLSQLFIIVYPGDLCRETICHREILCFSFLLS